MLRLSSALVALTLVIACGEPPAPTPDAGPPAGGGGGGVIRVSKISPAGDFRILAPKFSPDNRQLAVLHSGSDEDSVAVMSVDGIQRETLAANASYLTSFAWKPDGTSLFYGGMDLHEIAPTGGTPTKIIDAFASMQLDLDSTGTKLLYTVNGSQTMYLVDLTAMPATQTAFLQKGQCPRFSPDGTKLAFHDGGKFKLMDLATEEVSDLGEGAHFFSSIEWFNDGKRLLVTTEDWIEIIDTSASPATRTKLYEAFAVLDVDLSPDEKKIAYAINGQKDLHILTGF